MHAHMCVVCMCVLMCVCACVCVCVLMRVHFCHSHVVDYVHPRETQDTLINGHWSTQPLVDLGSQHFMNCKVTLR